MILTGLILIGAFNDGKFEIGESIFGGADVKSLFGAGVNTNVLERRCTDLSV